MSIKTRKAYSLLELSIVITIISILITGAMSTATSTINSSKNKVTRQKLEIIYKAIGNFVSANGRLPCPANLTLLESGASYGQEVSGCSSMTSNANGIFVSATSPNLIYGMVPVTTLGLSNNFGEDEFETKISYVIDKNFTTSANQSVAPDLSQSNFSTQAMVNTSNNITIAEKDGSTQFNPLTNAFIVLISHGANKGGGYPVNSASQNAAPADADELSNIGGSSSFDNIFISVSRNSERFDDMMIYSNPRIFVTEFNLFRLIPCNRMANYALPPSIGSNPDSNYPNSNSGGNAWFSQTIVGNGCSGSGDIDKFHSKKCGPFGQWIIQSSCSLPN